MSRNKISDVLHGLREVAHYALHKGETLPTKFTEEKPQKDEQVSQEDASTKPRLRFSEDCVMVLAPELLEQIHAVFDNPTNTTACSVPCYFNDTLADIEVYVFPRVMRTQGRQPITQPFVTLSVLDKTTDEEVAGAVYSADEQQRFMEDMHRIILKDFSSERMREELHEQFGINISAPAEIILTHAEPQENNTKESSHEIN